MGIAFFQACLHCAEVQRSSVALEQWLVKHQYDATDG